MKDFRQTSSTGIYFEEIQNGVYGCLEIQKSRV